MNVARTVVVSTTLVALVATSAARADYTAEEALERIGADRGIVALVGLPEGNARVPVEVARAGELVVYFQSPDSRQVLAVRRRAESAGLLGRRLFADVGASNRLKLGDNVADCVLVADGEGGDVEPSELLRVLRPKGKAYRSDQPPLVKPVPDGIDQWTHPYHGPDNNPQSEDRLVKGELRTQFLAEPKFSPMPEQTVVAGGRIFKAMGHIAHKANQNAMLNTLLCSNAYNGTILWKRELPEGFMIHRNTMIATDDSLYLGDHESCKVIDAATGRIRDEIRVSPEISDGPVWKWMAMRGDTLYALVGHMEVKVDTMKSARRGLGHWPWDMWKGHDYEDAKSAFGFGRTLVAIDLKSKQVVWHHRDEDFLDARGTCMNDRQLFCFSPGKFLACIDLEDGEISWKSDDKQLLDAIGPNQRAQHYVTGYATSCYIKCNDDYLFFAGPQRAKMSVVSARDGKLAWTHPDGNLQLVLRPDAIYAAGPNTTGVRLDYESGLKLGSLPTRRACTRATGCADSIFYRTSGGTVRVMTDEGTAQHIAPMRPPCQDGVIVSNGHLYWGPWMCGCQLSLYGHIALGVAPEGELAGDDALITAENHDHVARFPVDEQDWTSYRAGNERDDVTEAPVAANVEQSWSIDVSGNELPTAPVTAGGLVFVADRRGAVRAINEKGQPVWKSYTGGAVYYPPAVADGRVFVGSADGRVYAFEAGTGRSLWSYRVGPRDVRIPVFGKLISNWPVAGGVVVQDGKVYAAAGISHFDGTYVVSLDAVSGRPLATNSTSGKLAPDVNSGISLQGELSIVGGELRFLAGGVYETARYDLDTLECLNRPKNQVTSQFRTAFYPYYPSYGKYVSLDYTCGDGCSLIHDASYEGSVFTNLALHEPLPAGIDKPRKEASRWIQRRGGDAPATLWQDDQNRRFTGFVVSGDTLLATGHPDASPDQPFLAAVRIKDGQVVWHHALEADAVKGGTAIDRDGRIVVSLENGKLVCFEKAEG